MARRRGTRPLEDLLALVALLPWWAGVATALVAYLVLHALAGREVRPTVQPGQIGAAIGHNVITALAQPGQYLVPLLCLAGAGLSAARRHRRKALLTDVAQSRASDALDGMSWHAFELLVGEAFRQQGYDVVETGGNGPDGGVDLVLRRGGEKHLVQCKQWKAQKVGVDVVRQLYGVMAARGATTGFVVTSGRFTGEAQAFASGRNVRLVDGPKLLALIRSVQQRDRTATRQPEAQSTCPLCSKPMVRRLAQRGANAGKTFWGCTGFPTCRGTRLDA